MSDCFVSAGMKRHPSVALDSVAIENDYIFSVGYQGLDIAAVVIHPVNVFEFELAAAHIMREVSEATGPIDMWCVAAIWRRREGGKEEKY